MGIVDYLLMAAAIAAGAVVARIIARLVIRKRKDR